MKNKLRSIKMFLIALAIIVALYFVVKVMSAVLSLVFWIVIAAILIGVGYFWIKKRK